MTNRLNQLAEAAPGSESANVGTIRTTINVFVTMVVVWVISEITGRFFDMTHPVVTVFVAAVVGFGYRLSRAIAARWPSVGWVLFGIGTPPRYG